LNGQSADETLDSFYVVHVQVDLLLKHIEILIHLYFEVVATRLNLAFQLVHFLFLQTFLTAISELTYPARSAFL
jgi:hypothetical protein